MPLHIGKGRTESTAISDIIDYVANPQKTDNGRLVTGYECDSRIADTEFVMAKRQYIATTGRVRGKDDVIAYHGLGDVYKRQITLFGVLSIWTVTENSETSGAAQRLFGV